MKENNIKFRTKSEILFDSVFILNSPITKGAKYMALNDVCWQWTEFEGKYEGCRYWSEEAIKLLKNLKNDNEKFKYSDYFRHEHIVPRKGLIEKIFNIKNINEEILEKVLNKYLIGVVVTISEEKVLNKFGYKQNMPKEFYQSDNKNYNNEWLRYKKLSILVKNVDWVKKDIIEKEFIQF